MLAARLQDQFEAVCFDDRNVEAPSQHNEMSEELHSISATNVNPQGVIYLNLMTFKTEPCKVMSFHNTKQCLYYHDS